MLYFFTSITLRGRYYERANISFVKEKEKDHQRLETASLIGAVNRITSRDGSSHEFH